MKRTLTVLGLCAALPLCAQQLQVNAPATAAVYEDDQTLGIAPGVTLGAGDTAVFSATLTMTLPSEAIDRNEVLEDKAAVTADSDGAVLVYANGAWQEAGLTVAEGDTLAVEVVASSRTEGQVDYRFTLRKGEETRTVTVGAQGEAAFSILQLEGEGQATALAVANVSQGILPAGDEGAQDAALVAKYVTWLNDSAKGGAMPEGASETELSDAFAMNVGGAPSLAITDIDVAARTITVVGAYAADAGEVPVDLGAINGTLYLTYAATLDGPATHAKVEASAVDGGAATVALPEGAVFMKARVALTPPTDDTL